MSIPATQNVVKLLELKLCPLMWPHPLAWYGRSRTVWSWRCCCIASADGLASLAWALRSTQEQYIWPQVLEEVARCENWQQLPKLLPGCFHMGSDCQITVSGSGKHVIQVAEGSYHLQLIRSNLNFTLLHFCTKFAAIAVDAVVAYSCLSITLIRS